MVRKYLYWAVVITWALLTWKVIMERMKPVKVRTMRREWDKCCIHSTSGFVEWLAKECLVREWHCQKQPGLLIHTGDTSAWVSTPGTLFRQQNLKTMLKRSSSLLNEAELSFKNRAAIYCISGAQSGWVGYFNTMFWERCEFKPVMQLTKLEDTPSSATQTNSPSACSFEISQ